MTPDRRAQLLSCDCQIVSSAKLHDPDCKVPLCEEWDAELHATETQRDAARDQLVAERRQLISEQAALQERLRAAVDEADSARVTVQRTLEQADAAETYIAQLTEAWGQPEVPPREAL